MAYNKVVGPFTFGPVANTEINFSDNLAALTRWNEMVIKPISSSLTTEQNKRYARFLNWLTDHYYKNDITINSNELLKYKSVESIMDLIRRCESMYAKGTVLSNESFISLNNISDITMRK